MRILEATSAAITLLLSGDGQLWTVIGTSLGIAAAALAAAAPLAVGGAYLLAGPPFRGQGTLVALLHALLATPTVVVGLVLFLLLSRAGPLGALGLLFTPTAVAVGQFCIALPILTAFAHNTLHPNLARVRETAITLGASRPQALLAVVAENRHGLLAALLAGFGRVISEVGCALLVGGNIAGVTRTLPTAIALDTSKGLFAHGIALGLVLLALAMLASLALFRLQARRTQH